MRILLTILFTSMFVAVFLLESIETTLMRHEYLILQIMYVDYSVGIFGAM